MSVVEEAPAKPSPDADPPRPARRRTADTSVSNLLAKMGMSRRTEAAVYAARHRVSRD
jgi:hypothetical protein